MAGGDIKITLADEGAKIMWADELEEVLPPWEMDEVVPSWDDPHWSRCKVKQVKPAARSVRVRKTVHIKKEHTYPHLVPICTYLAMKLGEKGMKKLMKEEQAKTEQDLEQKLGEGALQRQIRGWESGEQIVSVGVGGKAQWCVTLLAMGPCSPLITPPIAIKQHAKQDKERGPMSGVEEEVYK